MSGFVALHVRPIRTHPLRAFLSISGVAVGIALMVSMLGLFSSMSTAADRLASLAGGADIEVSASNDSGLPAGLLDEIAAIPGVKVAAPLVRSNIVAAGAPVMFIGLDARLSELGGSGINLQACIPKTLRAGTGVLVGPALRDASSLRLTTTAHEGSVPILGKISCEAARGINKGKFVAAPVELAEALSGRPGRPDAIEIKAAGAVGRAELTQRIDDVVAGRGIVASPRLLAQQAKSGTAAFKQGTSVMVGLALVVGAFCVFNTVSMTALERRKELATLRAVGGHRRRLLRGFLAEMTLLGVLGSILGIVVGTAAGTELIKRVPPILIQTVGVEPNFVLTRSMIVMAIVLGTVVTLGAAIFPARSAVTIDPVEAMRSEGPAESPVTSTRADNATVILGLIVFAVGTGLAVSGVGVAAALIGFSTITVGSLIAQYGARAHIANATAWVASKCGNAGRLASASIARAPRRTWATVTAVAVAVITVVAMGGVTSNQIQTFTGPFESMKASDLWIGTGSTQVIPVNIRFPESMLDQVRAVPGVARVVGIQSSYTTIGKDRVLLQGTGGPSNSAQFAALSPESQRRLLDPSHPVATVTQAFADRQGIGIGETLTLASPTGPLRVPVIDIVDVVAPTQAGVVVLNLAVLQRAFERPGVTWIEATAKPGVSRRVLKERVTRALAHSPTPAFVSTGDEAYAGARFSVSQSTQIVTSMEIAVLVGTAFALGNALLISVIERRRELGIIRAIGISRPQVRNMVLIEAGAIGVIGIGLGGVQGLAQHAAGDRAVEVLLNARVTYTFTPNPLLAVTVAVLVVAFVAALVPAFRAARTNVIEAIGYE